MENRETLNRAIDVWGVESQVILAMEECAELIVELSHEWRGRPANVVEEIADVQILLDELKLIFGEAKIKQIIERKMQRLHMRLAGENPFDYEVANLAIKLQAEEKPLVRMEVETTNAMA